MGHTVRRNRGFTVLELLVSTGVISLLMAMLLPAVQWAREAARGLSCRNHLKQVGLALHNYHDVHKLFPMGGFAHPGSRPGSSTVAAMAGLSFWVPILPQLDQGAAFSEFVTNRPGSGDVLNGPNAAIARRLSFTWLRCPSASIDLSTGTVSGADYMTPAYAGISGATFTNGMNEDFIKRNAFPWPACGKGLPGQISWAGLLCANVSFGMRDAEDGLSNVLLVGECSDRAITSDRILSRIDAAYGLTGTWIRGTDSLGQGKSYQLPTAPIMTRPHSLTTIAHSVNDREIPIESTCLTESPNRPLRSPHPGGAFVLKADGSVRAAATGLDLLLLKRLSSRADGSVTEW